MRFFHVLILSLFLLASCSSFMVDSDYATVKGYESGVYKFKADFSRYEKVLFKKDASVKLYVSTGDDYVKVYAYPAETEFLKADRTNILYLFQEDFPGDKFSKEEFDKKLFEILTQSK